jgi:hypothetical protein
MICVEWIDIDSPRKMAIIGVDGKFGNLGRLKLDFRLGRSPLTKMFSRRTQLGKPLRFTVQHANRASSVKRIHGGLGTSRQSAGKPVSGLWHLSFGGPAVTSLTIG